MPTIVLWKPDVFEEHKTGWLGTDYFYNNIIQHTMFPKLYSPEIVWDRVKLLTAHYAEHQGKDFYDRLMQFMLSGEIHAFHMTWPIVEGRTWLEKIRAGRSGPRNLAHASDSVEAYERERRIWFPLPGDAE